MSSVARQRTSGIAGHSLWFGEREAPLLSDPDDLQEKLALAVNIRQLDPLPCPEGFQQRSSIRIAGDIGLAAIASTPTQSSYDDHHECAIAVLQYGRIDYELAGQIWSAEAGLSAVFLSGEAMRVRTTPHAGVVFNLSPQLLARYLGDRPEPMPIEQALAWVQRPHRIDLRHPTAQPSLRALRMVLGLLDDPACAPGQLPQLLGLDTMLYGLSAALIAPR